MARRKQIRSEEEAQALADQVNYEHHRKARLRRQRKQRLTNEAYWENLPVSVYHSIIAAFDRNEQKKQLARRLGYPYSFIVYVYTHHYHPSKLETDDADLRTDSRQL